MEIVIASQNLHKVREYREMLKALPVLDVLSLLDFPAYKPPEDKGRTLKDSAVAKAEHAARALQKWVLADESGIVIPALNSAVEKDSRFFCGEDTTDAESRQRVLHALRGKSDVQRSAYLECAIALANVEGIKKCVTSVCEGVITEDERGRHGFGYDAIFCKHDYDKTFAELDDTVKIRISDRRKAFEKLALFLETLLP